MLSLRRSSMRWMWPIAIGLLFTVLLLAVSAASAQPIGSPLDQTGARPTGALLIPKVPDAVGPPAVNGKCDDVAYTYGITVPYSDSGGATGFVHLLHNANNLYVCLQAPPGQFKDRFASVYLDTDNGKETFAEAEDYGLKAMISGGATSSFKGDGLGGYVAYTLNGWSASTASGTNDVAEYAIGNSLTGGACGGPFGLSVRHQQVELATDDFGWPDGGAFNKPDTWQEVQLDQQTCGSGKIAYVYRHDTATAGDFKSLLEGAGFTVQLIPQSSVTATNFSAFDLTIIADDTGSLNEWGTPAVSITPIITPNKPIIGLGEGGYAFFGKAASPIGWPHGWHGPQANVLDLGALTNPYYLSPNNLSGSLPGPFPLYGAPSNEVGIYMPAVPASVIPIGWEPPSIPAGNPDHASLTRDDCHHLWGFSGGPTAMNGSGRNLFLNAVTYMRSYQCTVVSQPPSNCVTVVKTAQPAAPGPVTPGSVITYTLNYAVPVGAGCPTKEATLIDPVPDHTLFVPGSAGGVTPNIENILTWPLGTIGPGSSGSKSFAVQILDTACNDQRVITNTATVLFGGLPFNSNTTAHNVNCPPVVPPNHEPPYAEEEVLVYPYPLVTGASTHLSAKVRSLSATTQTVTVTFQTSPNRFGIGIPFSALVVPGNPRVVTLPPYATVEVGIDWTPLSSGHYCIQVKIEGVGFTPIYTQRNLDVTEDLRPGVTDVLTFAVMNPTANPATIQLVVDNTCPGWTAVVNPSSIATSPGTIYTATLSVTPPNPATLGTGCHIDVQGWIGSQLIGGIRKLDVPPIPLPPGNPPWLEQEISTIPTEPISGTVNQLCVELQNPLAITREVTVTFNEADFGAGIGFTPIHPLPATHTFELPPHSLNKYCVDWTPMAGGTLHRCILIDLDVPGFQTQHSQRNLELVRRAPLWNPGGVAVPFVIGNPHLYPSEVSLTGILIGLNNWMPQFDPAPPYMLGPGVTQNVMLHLVPAVQRAPNMTNAPAALAGDVVRADVTLLLDGEPSSGFSVEFTPPLNVFLPLILK
jgi:hypothetical protein